MIYYCTNKAIPDTHYRSATHAVNFSLFVREVGGGQTLRDDPGFVKFPDIVR
jgi:hypothetical protein